MLSFKMSKAGYQSRSTTERFLVGQVDGNLQTSQLPTNREVLKYLFYKKHNEESKTKKKPSLSDIVCCPLNKEKISKCEETASCDPDLPCVVRKIKEPWTKAGIKTIKDHSISLKVKQTG